MKKIITLLLLSMVLLAVSANNYAIEKKTNRDRNFILSTIKNQGRIVARFCLVDPEPFYFYSIESDGGLFPNIEENLNILAERKGRGRPGAMILVDFRNQEKIKKPFNFKYLVNYLFIISFSPAYLKKVEILNPHKKSTMFFVETKVDGKVYYGALELQEPYEAHEAKKFIQSIKGAGEISLIVPVLDNVPVKLVVMQGEAAVTLYESFPGHRHFSCIFLASEKK